MRFHDKISSVDEDKSVRKEKAGNQTNSEDPWQRLRVSEPQLPVIHLPLFLFTLVKPPFLFQRVLQNKIADSRIMDTLEEKQIAAI